MWAEEYSTQILPGYFLNLALIAHSDEALLAALFLFIWHFYNVHLSTSVFPMGTVFITGYLPENLMVEEHYQHYYEIMHAEGREHEMLPPHDSSHYSLKPDEATEQLEDQKLKPAIETEGGIR